MQMILTPAFIRRSALARSSPNSRSSSAISLPGTECRENLFVFGESDVTSHRARLNAIDTNIAASSTELDKLGSRLQTLASMINSSIALLANTGSIAGGNPHGILSLPPEPVEGARAAKPIREQVVRLQLAEHTRALTLAIAENAGNRDLGVVIEDRLRHAVEERERSHVPVAERFRRLRRVAHHEDRVGVRQVHREEVDLALDAADYAD